MNSQPHAPGWYGRLLSLVAYLRSHPVLAVTATLLTLAVIVGCERLGPAAIDFTPFFVLPLLLAVYTVNRGFALVLAILIPLLGLAAGMLEQQPVEAALANFLIRASVSAVLVLLAAAAIQMRALQDEALRLRTLHDAVVTINDAMRNHLQALLNVCELSEVGKPLTAAQIAVCRRAVQSAVELLDRLGSQAGLPPSGSSGPAQPEPPQKA